MSSTPRTVIGSARRLMSPASSRHLPCPLPTCPSSGASAAQDFVRLAARVNATILPFSGIGGDESFTMALDNQELLAAPLIGDFFKERIGDLPSLGTHARAQTLESRPAPTASDQSCARAPLPSLVEGDDFVPPFGAITPARHYFLFGTPISTAAIDPSDRVRARERPERSWPP